MPKVREVVVNGIICQSTPKAMEITGGPLWELKYYLRTGRTMFNGFHIEYLRHEASRCPDSHEALDRFLREHKPRPRGKPIRIPERWPILSRRHVTMHLGIYR